MSGLTVGVDVGGTKLLAGLVDADGRVLQQVRRATPPREQAPEIVEAAIVTAVRKLDVDRGVDAVGVGAAGFVDLEGAVVFAPHLPWRNEALATVLSKALNLRVVVDNDANMMARAESRFGAAVAASSALCVTLGTGIGGAVVMGGSVWRGANGFAGEFGHMPLVQEGLPCHCGQRGCWEVYCSGRALVRAALALGAPADVTGHQVAEAGDESTVWAVDAFREVGEWLGAGLAGLVAAFDPEVVVVGGGVAEAGDLLLEPAREVLAKRVTGAGHRRVPEVRQAELGERAGMIGAAELARSLL